MGKSNTGKKPRDSHLPSSAATLARPLGASLVLFALAAALGLILRFAFVLELPAWIDYRNIQHAHSHIALLGWLFGAFYLVIIGAFSLDYGRYRRLYWLLQASVAGMAISFPIVGYNHISIAFTTIHMILSYVFAFRAWKELDQQQKTELPVHFLKASLVFMVLSTLGTWALGPIIALGLKGSAWYYGAIQFYLHFQFNGWLVFAMLAIALQLLKQHNVHFSRVRMQMFFRILIISVLLTFALAVTWSTPHPLIFGANSAGVLIQLAALILFVQIIREHLRAIGPIFSPFIRRLLLIAGIALIIKILVQTAVAIPAIAEISYTIRNFVVGFIHLLMLGCLSLFLLAIIAEITGRKPDVTATWIFITGVVATELLLFVQGIAFWKGWGFIPYYYILLASFSTLILIGVTIHTVKFILNKE